MYSLDALQTAGVVFFPPLDLRVSEIVCEAFKRGISISYSTFGLLDVSAVGFLSQSFLGLISLVKITGVSVPDVGHQPLAPLIEALYW